MNPVSTAATGTAVLDADLAEQALPGHGIPSQDPAPGAQMPLMPREEKREGQSVLVGGSLVAGVAAGAAVGVAVAGPVGVVVGGALGAAVGALGGTAVAAVTPEAFTGDQAMADDDVQLHIEDSGGSGRPVVLIHGWPLSADAWRLQVPALEAAGYRVVAYDRRGFGRSDKPESGYGYDTLADDLQRVMDTCGLQDATLVGFSMGGGEVARYVARHGESWLRSVVFAAAVPPCLMQSADNPEGPLTPEKAAAKRAAFEAGRMAYFDAFTTSFFSAHDQLLVTDVQRAEAMAVCLESAPHAALACMDAFATTDFRDDLKQITVPTLIIHGDADAIVPIEGSGLRTHRAVAHSQLVTVAGAPHGLNVSHAQAFNDALLAFLRD
jgi:pimeloyl-ACP methyl ester carboxylesterase